jgi:zinc D-Ala-D-Ala carboxypeptidase|tara:strand:+ start:5585 stop:5944 length:360 start_codon:yes stop_codon:yes gene_type:complete
VNRLKFFQPEEFECDGVNCFDKMSPLLLSMLDMAREMSGTPFQITSSWRSIDKNLNVGGKPNSAHLRGNAVDIACKNSQARFEIMDGLIMAGFNRIGIGDDFIHVDVDEILPQDVIWKY